MRCNFEFPAIMDKEANFFQNFRACLLPILLYEEIVNILAHCVMTSWTQLRRREKMIKSKQFFAFWTERTSYKSVKQEFSISMKWNEGKDKFQLKISRMLVVSSKKMWVFEKIDESNFGTTRDLLTHYDRFDGYEKITGLFPKSFIESLKI